MPLTAGDRLGAYEILSPLGAGGMGEVYRARDPKLDREVAIKVLPAALAQHPDRLARFDREAKVLAAMNHPNIAVIYGLEDRAIVMELVEGPTLADRIADGALSLDESLRIAAQIADALEAAHEKGVVHRDLKPANVKVRDDGTVKVLDFGLATAVTSGEREPGNSANSPTLTMGATEVGVILGTAAYMSPEQASGKKADKRADIWSFGVVLYEMVTGKRLFTGETTSHVLAGVLARDPDFERVPVQVRRLVRGCLQKDVKRRLQAIGDWRLLLDEGGAGSPAQATTLPHKSTKLAWIAAALFLLAFAALAFLYFRETPPVVSPTRFDLALTEQRDYFTVSPDGRNLAYTDREANTVRLWVRALDSLEPRVLPGTDGVTYPFWSPDGTYLGFFAQGKLKKIALAGGPAQNLCDVPTPRGGSWNRDGVIIFSNVNGPLSRVADDGGAPQPLTKLTATAGGETHRYPEFILGAKRFLYTYLNAGDQSGIYAGSTDGSAPVRLLADQSRGLYVPAASGSRTGYVLFLRENALMALPFDPEKLRPTGPVISLVEELAQAVNTGFGAFSASESGTLFYRRSSRVQQLRNLTWIDRSGKRTMAGKEPQAATSLSLSPDGKRAAYSLRTANTAGDLWLQDLARETPERFTFDPGFSETPVWARDGSFIVYLNRNGSSQDLYKKPSNSAGKPELLLKGGINATPYDISPDGKWLVYSQTEAQTKNDLYLLPLQGEHKPEKYLDSPFNETFGQFSPDGKWMAYTSDESGQNQVYVQSIPATGEKHQVSTSGGSWPRWSQDGKELFYIAADVKLLSVPVKPGRTTFEFSAAQAVTPQPLYEGPANLANRAYGYALSPDARKFLAILPVAGAAAAAPPFTVWLNWQAGLKK